MESFSERRLLQSLAFDEVDYVSPIYLDFAQWKNPNTRNYWRNIFVLGINLRYPVLNLSGIPENIERLKMPNTVLFDEGSRTEFGTIAQDFRRDGRVSTELGNPNGNRKVNVVGLFQLGTSFGSDGNLVTSHINFLRIFDNRKKGLIDVGLIKLKPNQDTQRTLEKLRKYLPKDVQVLSKSEFVNFEKKYWQTSTAIGFIFNLGVALGIIVGVVVVYQILYTNVSEHLSEYATLKAMGYRHIYLLSMVLQQAFLIAVLGYIPGFLIANIQYEVTKNATLLPVNMSLDRAVFVFILTLVMAFVSGATAVKKLQDADPADIF
jgi:putative ABC transport system permease protein